MERTVALDARLAETSALAFDAAGRLFTVNDGEAVLYEVDTLTGAVVSERRLSPERSPTADWEALAIRGDTVYVGDFGNNASGNRTDLRVLRFRLGGDATVLPVVDTIAFSYADQSDLTPTAPNATDFDCEAMVVTADSVYLFTKEWVSFGAAVYALPNRPGRHVAQPRGRIDSLGLVTDAHFRPADSTLVLSGYSPILQPFVFLMTDVDAGRLPNAGGRRVQLNLSFHQVEGVASADGRRYFLSNERFRRSVIDVPAGLSVVELGGLLDGLRGGGTSATPEGRLSPKQGLQVWPNPTHERAWVRAAGIERVHVYDAAGREVGAWTLSGDRTEIDCRPWPAGVYWLVAPGGGVGRVVRR